MDPSHRIVTRMPLTELWNDHGQVDAVRAGRVGEAEIVRLLISYTSGAARTPSSFGGNTETFTGSFAYRPLGNSSPHRSVSSPVWRIPSSRNPPRGPPRDGR